MTIPPIVPLPDLASETIRRVVDQAEGGDMVFVTLPGYRIDVTGASLDRMRAVAGIWAAGLVYSDSVEVPRIDYATGSVRDDFDFGALVGVSRARALDVLRGADSPETSLRFGGLYDLRLRLAESAPVVRVPEPLYAQTAPRRESRGEAHFDYVDPATREYQVEMEAVATAHLRRIGAYLPERTRRVDEAEGSDFPVTATVVIPVRNRERTIGDAVQSALDQKAPFDFNVIVVDNRSTDRTPDMLAGFDDARLVVKVPVREDLGIGGCWNLVIESPECGRYALQLDSDDLFAGDSVLAAVVDRMRREGWAMLVGSYTTVDFSLAVVAPGLVDHREWSPGNGHNNLLRVNGLGAPRAFDVNTVRRIGFPNVSYGEDYAVGLRVSREFAIGRIYDSLYWCRRWEGNTDSSPTVDERNRFNAYKDWLRSAEIGARIAMNQKTPHS
jgi:hypothetical protein